MKCTLEAISTSKTEREGFPKNVVKIHGYGKTNQEALADAKVLVQRHKLEIVKGSIPMYNDYQDEV